MSKNNKKKKKKAQTNRNSKKKGEKHKNKKSPKRKASGSTQGWKECSTDTEELEYSNRVDAANRPVNEVLLFKTKGMEPEQEGSSGKSFTEAACECIQEDIEERDTIDSSRIIIVEGGHFHDFQKNPNHCAQSPQVESLPLTII